MTTMVIKLAMQCKNTKRISATYINKEWKKNTSLMYRVILTLLIPVVIGPPAKETDEDWTEVASDLLPMEHRLLPSRSLDASAVYRGDAS